MADMSGFRMGRRKLQVLEVLEDAKRNGRRPWMSITGIIMEAEGLQPLPGLYRGLRACAARLASSIAGRPLNDWDRDDPAMREADKLYAAFSRAVRTLRSQGLIEVHGGEPKACKNLFVISDRGSEVLREYRMGWCLT